VVEGSRKAWKRPSSLYQGELEGKALEFYLREGGEGDSCQQGKGVHQCPYPGEGTQTLGSDKSPAKNIHCLGEHRTRIFFGGRGGEALREPSKMFVLRPKNWGNNHAKICVGGGAQSTVTLGRQKSWLTGAAMGDRNDDENWDGGEKGVLEIE